MVDIAFPLKGLNTNSAQNSKPDGYSASLLNVLPFDRGNTLRGGMRPGLSKFISTQIGGGNSVQMVSQVVTALDPSTIVADTQLFSEPFTYADNTNVGSLANWRASTGGASFFPFLTSSVGKVHVEGNAAVNGDGSVAAAALYTAALAVGSAYIVKADVWVDHTTGSGATTWACGLMVRINVSTFAQDGILVYVMKDQIVLRNANGSVTTSFSFGTALTSGYHNLEVRVNGDTISGWVDGVQYVSISTTANNTVTGCGLFVGSGQGTSAQGVKNFQVLTGRPLAAFRQSNIIAVANGSVYQGDTSSLVITSGGSGILSTTIKPQMASSAGLCYIVDSQHNLKVLTISTQTVADIVPTAGSETATTLGAYSLACMWRNRLVLAASAAFPMNFIMSRQITLTDFDYSQTDAAAAVAGNASKAGAIGDPLNCLMPWTDDILILGGDHSIYSVSGDLAAGGAILAISDSVGTLGPDCWDVDPTGNLYFVGTNGLYRMAPGSGPMNLSDANIRSIFTGLNRSTTYVVCNWDRDRNGLWIHLTPVVSGTATHLFYDASTGGFFPMQYPNSFGPISATLYDGDAAVDRQIVLGCRDGYLRKFSVSSISDDGTDISSYVFIGPFRPGGDAAISVLEALETIVGDPPSGFTETDVSMTVTTYTGSDAYRALNFPVRTVSYTTSFVGRRRRRLQRVAGGTFFFKISGVSGKIWSMEKLVAMFIEGGLQRRWVTNSD